MAWNKAITEEGYQLITKAVSGTKIQFTRMVIGDGVRTDGFSDATGAVHELYSLKLENVLRNNTKVTVTSATAPDTLDTGYDLREIIVFAKPEGGAEICFSAACNSDGAMHVEPRSNNVSIDRRIRWAYEIRPEGNVTIDTDVLLWAAWDHTHDTATQTAAGLLSADDKKNLDAVAGQVNQGVKTTDSPVFTGYTIANTGTYMDSNGVLHGAKYEA